MVNPLRKEVRRIVVGLGLDVLRQADRHRAGLRLIGEDPHRLRQAGQELLRPIDAIPEARDRDEGVVDADVHAQRVLELLQDRIGTARGEDVTRQQAAPAAD